jgi:uncharacterized membrane protein
LEEKSKNRARSNQMKKCIVLLVVAILFSCSDDEPKADFSCGEEVGLSADIMPIISANCAVNTCHANGVNPMLNTTSEVIANADRIQIRTSDGTMPPGGHAPLTTHEIELISCWVDDGTKNN